MSHEYTDDEIIEILRRTNKIFGPLYPILEAPDGTIIDGKHRLEADPNWPKIKIDWVKNPAEIELLRLISNWIRREIQPEEKAQSLAKIADLTKWTPQIISENLGIPYRTIMRYLPDEYKRAGGYERIATVAIQQDEYDEALRRMGVTVPAGMPEAFDEDPSLSPSKLMGKGTGGATEESEDAPAAGAGRVDESVALSVDKSVGPAPAQMAADYVRGYFARYLRPDEEFLRLYLCDKFSFTERQARAVIEGVKAERTGTVGPPSSTQTETTAGVQPVGKWESDQAPTCRCPMCGRDGADKTQILANWVEDPEMAQMTLFDFVTGAFKR